jgi:hypothetical protein
VGDFAFGAITGTVSFPAVLFMRIRQAGLFVAVAVALTELKNGLETTVKPVK